MKENMCRMSWYGSNLLVINPVRSMKQEVTSDNNIVNQHLGIIDQVQRTTSMNPVALNMGNNVYLSEDLAIDGCSPIVFSRFYNSMSESFHEFGINWSHTYTFLLQDLGNTVVVRFNDGHVENYIKKADGTYQVPEGLKRELTANKDGSYTLLVEGTHFYVFSPNGKMKEIRDRNENTTKFSYVDGMLSKVENDSGFLLFSYHKDGSIQSVSDNGNRKISYQYQDGLLTCFIDTMGNETTYGYDSNNRLNKVISPDQVVLYKMEYDALDRVTKENGH